MSIVKIQDGGLAEICTIWVFSR